MSSDFFCSIELPLSSELPSLLIAQALWREHLCLQNKKAITTIVHKIDLQKFMSTLAFDTHAFVKAFVNAKKWLTKE